MKKRILKLSIAIFIVTIITSCVAFHSGYMVNSAALSTSNFTYVKMNVEGKSDAVYVLGIGGLDREALVNDAKQKLLESNPLKDNQTLANLTVNFKNEYYFGIVYIKTCRVTADIVEFKQIETVSPKSQVAVALPETKENKTTPVNIIEPQKPIVVENMPIFSDNQVTGTFIDSRDGRKYKIVKIGTQIWMAENLAHKVNNGCWAYDNNEANVSTYGYLYTWDIAKLVCPQGWHLPTDAEWTTLTNALGGENTAGDKLKNNFGWNENSGKNGNGNNESGFSASPGGYLTYNNSSFAYIGKYGNWWSSTEADANNVWVRTLRNDYKGVQRYNMRKNAAYSIRCVKD